MDNMYKMLLMTIVKTFTPGLSLSKWSTIAETAGLYTSHAKSVSPFPRSLNPFSAYMPLQPCETPSPLVVMVPHCRALITLPVEIIRPIIWNSGLAIAPALLYES